MSAAAMVGSLDAPKYSRTTRPQPCEEVQCEAPQTADTNMGCKNPEAMFHLPPRRRFATSHPGEVPLRKNGLVWLHQRDEAGERGLRIPARSNHGGRRLGKECIGPTGGVLTPLLPWWPGRFGNSTMHEFMRTLELN
jgi:hypothetical protein